MDVYVVLYEHATKGYALTVVGAYKNEEEAKSRVKFFRDKIKNEQKGERIKDTCWYVTTNLN